LGGFAFDPTRQADPSWKEYPDALLVLPRYLFISYQESSWLSVNVLAAPGCNRQVTAEAIVQALRNLLQENETEIKEEQTENIVVQQDEDGGARWKEKIVAIVNEIESKVIEKLVLARQVTISSPHPLDPGAIVSRLHNGYGHCTLFAFASNQSCFIGATPERLVRLDGKTVRTDCLAGSTNRDEDSTKDRVLGETLLADPKERREHALVKRALQDCLTPFCTHLSAPETPTLLRMPNVQHLYTPLKGVLREDSDIFGLVERLHPTPATGGLPRETAYTLLRTYEGFDRGWYAGPVGWVDGHGSGEFVVAIRSALLRDHDAKLYAGCGIVAGSDPEREYAESCLKLRPMLWALSNRRN
jgi:menaquinone-specific isochorismate synthase